jgi:hypothetical protein
MSIFTTSVECKNCGRTGLCKDSGGIMPEGDRVWLVLASYDFHGRGIVRLPFCSIPCLSSFVSNQENKPLLGG